MRDVSCSLMKPYCKVYQNNYSYFFILWIIYFNYTYATYEYIVLIFSFSFSYFSTLSVVLASMVTILRICALHLPIQSAHTHSSEHTVNTHPEQWEAIYAAAPGEQSGFSVLLKSTSVVVLKEERSAGHSLPPPTIPAGPETRTHNLSITSLTL